MAAAIGAIIGAIPGIGLWIWTSTWDDNNPDIGLAQLIGWGLAIMAWVIGVPVSACFGSLAARLLRRTIKNAALAIVAGGLMGGITGAGITVGFVYSSLRWRWLI